MQEGVQNKVCCEQFLVVQWNFRCRFKVWILHMTRLFDKVDFIMVSDRPLFTQRCCSYSYMSLLGSSFLYFYSSSVYQLKSSWKPTTPFSCLKDDQVVLKLEYLMLGGFGDFSHPTPRNLCGRGQPRAMRLVNFNLCCILAETTIYYWSSILF